MVGTMNIDWKPGEETFALMEQMFLGLGKKAISMNHYDFAEATRGQDLTAQDWKDFLSDPRVLAYTEKEFDAIRNAEFRKIIVDINSSRSIGQAQIINSLSKMMDDGQDTKSGPAFIYTYIPLTSNQEKLENVEVLDSDPFRDS